MLLAKSKKPTPAKPLVIKPKEPKEPKETFVVIGLDISLRHTGWVVLGQDAKLIAHGTIENPKPKEPWGKLGQYNVVVMGIRNLALKYMCGYEAVHMVREDYAFAAGSSSDTLLKELGGIIEWELNRNPRVKWSTVGVSQIKKWCSGKGDVDKDVVMDGVYKRFQFEGNEHECDAYGAASLRLEALVPGTFVCDKPHLEVAKKVRDKAEALPED